MNNELIKQVSEIIKDTNIIFDGKLNSEVVIKVTEKIIWMLQIKSVVIHIIWALAVVISAWLIGKSILKAE